MKKTNRHAEPCPFCGESASIYTANDKLFIRLAHQTKCPIAVLHNRNTYTLITEEELDIWNCRIVNAGD